MRHVMVVMVLLLSTIWAQEPLPEVPRSQAVYPTFWQVVKDPYFAYPSIGQWSAVGFDAGITAYGLRQGRCVEANRDLGTHPSDLKIFGYNLLVDGVVTGFRYAAIKAIPVHSHSKLRWIPRGVSVGLAAYSMHEHTVGGSHWFTYGCL